MKLIYSQWAAHDAGVTLQPDEDLKRLGISYDGGWAVDGTATFVGCKNVPDVLPAYISRTEPRVTYVFGQAGKEPK